jgi:hypothetical protein
MSTNAHTTRPSVLTGTTAVMFGGQALAETPTRGPFTGLEDGLEQSQSRTRHGQDPLITTPDVTGYWPRTTRPVRGPKESQDGQGAQPRSAVYCAAGRRGVR